MDPRIQRSRQRVLDAAGELLIEGGPNAVTIEGVVVRSGVAKTTIYRHWPSHAALIIDLFEHVAPTIDPPDPSLSPRDALVAVCRSLAKALDDERWQRLVPALLLTRIEYGEIDELRQRIDHEHVSVLTEVIERLIEAGEIRPDAIEDARHLLIGPLLTRSLMDADSSDPGFAERVVEHYLRGAAADSP